MRITSPGDTYGDAARAETPERILDAQDLYLRGEAFRFAAFEIPARRIAGATASLASVTAGVASKFLCKLLAKEMGQPPRRNRYGLNRRAAQITQAAADRVANEEPHGQHRRGRGYAQRDRNVYARVLARAFDQQRKERGHRIALRVCDVS